VEQTTDSNNNDRLKRNSENRYFGKNRYVHPNSFIPSEQLFSAAGDLVREKRSRLSHKHVDVLLFLNKNA
jgi:hypothetical protein